MHKPSLFPVLCFFNTHEAQGLPSLIWIPVRSLLSGSPPTATPPPLHFSLTVPTARDKGHSACLSPVGLPPPRPAPRASPPAMQGSPHTLSLLWKAAPFSLGRHDLHVLPQPPGRKAIKNSWTENAQCNVSSPSWQSRANSRKASERML